MFLKLDGQNFEGGKTRLNYLKIQNYKLFPQSYISLDSVGFPSFSRPIF